MKFRIATIGALVFLALATFFELSNPIWLDNLRAKAFDLYQRLGPLEAKPPRVLILDIDDKSLAALGQWPWPRTVLARLFERVMAGGAVVLGVDIVFPEPDRMSPGVLADHLEGISQPLRDELKKLPSNDVHFARVLSQYRIVLGNMAVITERPANTPDGKPKIAIALLDSDPDGDKAGDPGKFLIEFPTVIGNVASLNKAAQGLGVLSRSQEFDNVFRRVPLALRSAGKIYPALSLEMLRLAFNESTIVIRQNSAGIEHVIVKKLQIPTDRNGRIWVRYRPHDRTRYVSAIDILNGTVPASIFRGRPVLFGASAVGIGDIVETPIHDALPGVEVHAQTLETIIDQDFLSRPGFANSVEAFIGLLAGIMIIVLVPRLGPGWTFGLLLLFTGALVATAGYAYKYQRILIDVTQPGAIAFVVYLVMAFDNYFKDSASKRRIRAAFGHYLSPALVAKLANDSEQLHLGGETKNLSILFCDIHGFTTISEAYKTDPQALTELINRLLTPLTEAILARNGTIDKYMGDCIMAFWNAPMDTPEHPRLACESALAMLAALAQVNQVIEAEATVAGRAHHELKVGVGLNTADVVVGNMGSEQRFDYTILGDGVNLASRLEGQSRVYGVDIIATEETMRQVPDLAWIELDLIAVKGRREAARIYTLLGDGSLTGDDAFTAFAAEHAKMLAAYRNCDWEEARALGHACEKLRPDLDGLYDLFRERIAEFAKNPPPADWDGIFVAETK